MPLSIGFKRYALEFDGVDDYVEVPDSPSLNFTVNNQLTVEAWVIDSVVDDTYRTIVSKDGEFLLRRTNAGEGNDFEFFIYDGSSWEPRVDSGVVPERGKWYFVVGVFDGSELRIYVNGELKGSKDRVATLSDTTNPLKIGMFNGGYRWNGVITLIRIYNRVLSEREIRYNMLNYHNPVRNGLILWFHDKIVGNTWYDESGQGNHGTIYGATKVKVKQYEIRAEVGL